MPATLESQPHFCPLVGVRRLTLWFGLEPLTNILKPAYEEFT